MGRREELEKALREKGIDPVALEREVIALFRKGASSLEVEDYLRRVIEGVGRSER